MVLLVGCVVLPGCTGLGLVAYFLGGGEKDEDVLAAYRGLEGKTVALLVSADSMAMHRHPQAAERTRAAVTQQLRALVPGIRIAPPERVTAFKTQNPYWYTMPYRQLIDTLGVERLIVIDLAEYRTHEPGNQHVWRGVVSGAVHVVEAEQREFGRPAFSRTVRAAYPEDSDIGMVEAEASTVELRALGGFAIQVARLFVDHERVIPS